MPSSVLYILAATCFLDALLFFALGYPMAAGSFPVDAYGKPPIKDEADRQRRLRINRVAGRDLIVFGWASLALIPVLLFAPLPTMTLFWIFMGVMMGGSGWMAVNTVLATREQPGDGQDHRGAHRREPPVR